MGWAVAHMGSIDPRGLFTFRAIERRVYGISCMGFCDISTFKCAGNVENLGENHVHLRVENREVIGGAGFTFAPGDAKDLERMLRLLIEAPEIRGITGIRARERVRELYQWDRVTTEIRGIYLQLMNASPDPANAFVEPAVAEPRSGTDVAA